MPPRWVWLAVGTLAAALGVTGAWMARHYVGPDGLSYLEIACNFLDQGPLGLANGYWSPVYPVFIALGLLITGRVPLLEYPGVHIGNWLGYVLSMIAFWFFVTGLRRDAGGKPRETSWAWLLMAFAFFLDGDFNNNAPLLEITSPDILITAVAYWMAGLLVRIADEGERWKWWLWLGAALAVGFYTKSMYFAMAPLLMLLAAAIGGRRTSWTRRLAACAGLWAALAAPWVVMHTMREGRFSFGETGRLAYVWFVNHVRTPGGEGVRMCDLSKLVHPPVVLMSDPVVIYDYTGGPAGTIPTWIDQSYYGAGVAAITDWPAMRGIAKASAVYVWKLLVVPFAPVPIALLLVLLTGIGGRGRNGSVDWRRLSLLAFPVIPFVMYSVIVIQYRYLPAYWVIVWLILWDAADRLVGGRRRVLMMVACAVVAVFLGWRLAGHLKPRIESLRQWPEAHGSLANAPYDRVGLSLNALGAGPGSRVVALGDNFWHLYARPARVRVAGQIDPLDVKKFWKLEEGDRERIYRTLAEAGFRAIIATRKPPSGQPAWQLLGGVDYDYWVRMLP